MEGPHVIKSDIMKEYKFYGWKDADVKAVNKIYKGIESPYDLYDVLSELWCAETCAPRMRDKWSPDNKTLGQCSITAFLLQDIYGGRVLGVPLGDGNYHCFNEVGDCVFDLTSEQFGDVKLNYEHCPEQHRELHFAKAEKKERYERLRQALLSHVNQMGAN